MDLKASCPQCHRQYTVKESQLFAGPLKVRCPNCHHIWVVGEKHPSQGENIIPVPLLKFPLDPFISLRIVVAFLGEKNQLNWWDTNFLSPTGQKYLQIIFPRTAFVAGLNSISQAAKRLHDDRIGKGGAYHLFRLPDFIERKIQEQMTSADASDYLNTIQTSETALAHLKSLTTGNPKEARGPVQVGTISALSSPTSISKLANYYYYGFSLGQQVFPYLIQALNG